jgi:hypothetical protein
MIGAIMEETEVKKEFKWRVLFNGRKDTPAERAVAKFLTTFTIWNPSETHIITGVEFKRMVEAGEIDGTSDFYTIGENKIGYISLKCYAKYTEDWEKVRSAREDFLTGWYECQKLQDAELYEQAIKENDRWLDGLNRKAKKLIKERHSERIYIKKDSKKDSKKELSIEYKKLLYKILVSSLIGISEEDAIYVVDNYRR